MCIWQLPDPDWHDEQVAKVKNWELKILIQWCVEENPAMRPDADEVIEIN